MTNLPVSRMTLYKHGVGFFERRAQFSGEEVTLSFRVEEMNDILKSLTVIDWGDGQVLGVDYATPQSREERLAGNSIRLGDDRSLRDLLVGLRGRRVKLLLDQAESLSGTLLGLDEVGEEQPLARSLLSILLDESSQVQNVALRRLQGVAILDDRGADDLRFFLTTALSQENYRQVNIRLSAGEHDLMVSYVAPAPTWRVSYRLVADPAAEGGPWALLLGWGIFDNRIEEDLRNISLSLVAGMPVSFVYDLYTPFTPARPVVGEEKRVAARPVEFQGAVLDTLAAEAPPVPQAVGLMAAAAPAPIERSRAAKIAPAALEESTTTQASGTALGELFQYAITTPVSVGRGQSAMVPIVSANLPYRKELLYNGGKFPNHPVASLRLKNETGLTLERGPLTVVEEGEYVGEAILPFTVEAAEFLVPYAVELSVKVQERNGSGREVYALRLSGAYFLVEEWEIRWFEYQCNNSAAKEMTILIEHPRSSFYELFESPTPKEKTDSQWRFELAVPGRGESKLRLQTRRLTNRHEELQRQSYSGLRQYLERGLIDRATHDQVAELLRLWELLAIQEKRKAAINQEREQIYKGQKQIQGNMGVLSNTGREGTLRNQYVDQLEQSEKQLKTLADEEGRVMAEMERVKQEIDNKLKGMKGK